MCLQQIIMSLSPPHFEDSLDNLSGLQNNKNRQLVARVKQNFAQGLQKLQSAETREVGISELRKLIDAHREPQHLRSYIAILKGLKANSSSATKEHQILVVSILAQTFRDSLLDPLDKPPSILKTSLRLVESLHGYFSDRSPTVQQACARALLDLTAHCLSGQGAEAVFAIIYSPLISILKSGVDKGSQATAAACLHELILYNRKVADNATLTRLGPDLLAVFLRVNCEYHELFQAVHSLLQALGLNFLEGRVVAFLAKLLPVIAGTRQAANSSSNFNSYMCKVGVCKIIQRIGSLLPMTQKVKLADLNVIESLQQAARHRIMQVQLAAARALKSWKEERDESPRGLTSLQEKRASKQKERSKSKEEREKMENELTFMKEDLEKLVKGGWGASNRARNFVRQGTGIGGGYHGRMNPSPPNRSGSKSHKEHLDELRDHIKKGIEQNRNIDRFASAQLPRSQTPPQRPTKSPNQGQKLELQEFGLQVESGDQMVYEARSQKQAKPKKSFLEDAGISAQQAKDLMKHEDSLMHDARNMNINFNTGQSQKSKHSRQSTPSQKSYSQRQQQQLQQQSQQPSQQPSQRPSQQPTPLQTPQTQQPIQIPLISNEVKPKETPKSKEAKPQQQRKPTQTDKPKATVKPTRDKSQFVRLSHEELGELVDQYNLSQVSSNLQGVLNQSDLHMIESSKLPMMDSGVIEPEQGKSEIQTFKDIIGEKRNRKSIVSKFFKKEQSVLPENPSPKPPSLSPQPNISLNFTESAASRAVGKQDGQFTLNPKDRYSSLAPRLPEEHAQIEEDIAMSEYEESLPKGHPLPTYPPRLPQSSQFQPTQPPNYQYQPQKDLQPPQAQRQPIQVPPTPKPSPEQQADFQSLIKNPPKLLIIQPSQPSQSQPSQVREVEESEDLGQEWRHVVSLLKQGEIEQAFQCGLAMDDPIYLLRLLLISKCPLKKLTAETTRTLWRQFLDIYSRRFIDVLALGLFAEAHELSLLPKCLSVEELQELLLGLYQLSGTSKGKLSYRSATLYNEIETSLRSGRSQ